MLTKLRSPAARRRNFAEPYCMIKTLRLSNFRCYERLDLEDLGTVNVIVGDNGSGKTSLIESIFLTLGSGPNITFRLRAWRGMGNSLAATNQAGYDALWSDLFYKLDTKHIVSIELIGNRHDSNSLSIKYDSQSKKVVSLRNMTAGPDEEPPSELVLPVTFTYTQHGQRPYTVRARVRDGKIELGNVSHKMQAAFYSSAFSPTVGPIEPAHQFSEFSKRKKARVLVDAFKTLFPELDEVTVEIQTGIEMVFGDVPWIPVKIPVAMMSGGLNKMVAILLGIASQPKGVVLVDELENGIYYRMLPRTWSAMVNLAKQFEVQLFVVTHSRECLNALLPMIQGDESTFRLLKARRQRDRFSVALFSGKQLESAIIEEIDVR